MEKTRPDATVAAEATGQVANSPTDNGQKNNGELLSPAAFGLYRKDRRVPWKDICKVFADRSNGPVNQEEYRAFYQAWMEKNNILLTQDAYLEWRSYGGLALISLKEIKEKVGKSHGITPEELVPILEEQELETGFFPDGETAECYRCGGKFQFIVKILFDRRGQPVRRKDGEYVRVGNFLGIKARTGEFKLVALCYKCHQTTDELRRQLTFPRQEAEDFVCRQNKRLAAEEAATKEILCGIRRGSCLSENARVKLLKKR